MNSSHPTQKLLKDIGFTLLSEGKTIKVKAEGYSMYPSIKPGSIIFIEPLKEGENPIPGEIIAWENETGLIVHRHVRSYKEDDKLFLVTRGDSCLAEDPPLLPEKIAGRVVRIENKSGKSVPPAVYSKRRSPFLLNRSYLLVTLYLKKFTRLAGRLVPLL